MQCVAGAVGHEVADDRIADQRKIADGVEDLVADELVLETERVVENAGLAEDDGVLQRATERQAVLTQHLDVFQERERPRGCDFLDERLFGDAQRARLVAQQRMIVADAVGHLEMIGRIQRNPLVAARDRNRPDDFQILPGRLQPFHARFVNEIDERRRAAVHDRHLGRVQLDDDVVDPGAHERGEQMLDRLDRHLVARQPGRQLDPGQVLHSGRYFVIAQIGAAKTNTEIRWRGLEREVDLVAGVKTDSDAGNLPTYCALCVH